MDAGRRPGARVSSGAGGFPAGSPPSAPAFPPSRSSALVDAVPDAEARGDPAVSILDVALRFAGGRARAPCSAACPARAADGHDFARRRDRRGRGRARRRAVARCVGAPGARALGRGPPWADRRPCLPRPGGGDDDAGRHRHERQDHRRRTCWRRSPARPDVRAGVIGTTGARVDGDPVPLARTTPEATDLHRLLARMRDAGVSAGGDGGVVPRPRSSTGPTASSTTRSRSRTCPRTTWTSTGRWSGTSPRRPSCSRPSTPGEAS